MNTRKPRPNRRNPAAVEPRGNFRKTPKPAAKQKPQNTRMNGVGLGGRLYSWFDNHRNSCAETLIRLLSNWTSSILTWLVIGIAMALPVGLYVVLSNVESVAGNWDGNAKVSVYFKDGVSESQSLKLQHQYQKHPLVSDVAYLSQEEALEEFERISGFGDILQSLPANPLPSLLELTLGVTSTEVEDINTLVDEIGLSPVVESVQLDLHWVQRLQAILAFARQFVWVLASLLSIAVLLVTGNTIRLAIESRRDEIVVIKLVGGTDAFVRRPLLYTGFWYGLGGAIVASLIIHGSISLLAVPASTLFGLYDSQLSLQTLRADHIGFICLSGATLGLMGAWLSVAQHLHKIQPK